MTDDELQRALRALPREAEPPAELEEQVVSRLREEGLLERSAGFQPAGSPPSRRRRQDAGGPAGWKPALRVALRVAIAAAIAVALFLGGFAAGRTRDVEATHVLLVHRLDSTPEELRQRRREYGEWARNLAGGEKLSSDAWIIDRTRAAVSRTSEVSGYFLIRARDDDEALAIAKSCPHIRHGGRVELRRIE